jgi:membrane protein DedA with SNARE-associated domain
MTTKINLNKIGKIVVFLIVMTFIIYFFGYQASRIENDDPSKYFLYVVGLLVSLMVGALLYRDYRERSEKKA